MELRRFFTTDSVKGTRNYLNTQKKYEIVRTILYFAISLSLFAAGYIQTGRRANLLSIVAVLGCLPASKSAVGAIMFLRFRSCAEETSAEIERHTQGLVCLYDMVFGYAEGEGAFGEADFYTHIGDILKADGHKNVTVKIFTNLTKYTERLDQMKRPEPEDGLTRSVVATLKSVAL